MQYRFGEFRLDAASRQLWRGRRAVTLTPRALDTLIMLVRNPGRVVSKEELIAEVWNDVIVDENNLNQQISILRKALGDGYIETVPRKGYSFVAAVGDAREAQPSRRPLRARMALFLFLLAGLAVAPTMHFIPGRPETGRPRFDAYEAYLKGRYHWGLRTRPNFEKAIDHYRRAIALDPEYADAYAGLAMALGFLNHPADARVAANNALRLDPAQPELRAFLALERLHRDFNPELSRQEFERAAVLGPDNAIVHHWYAFYFSYTGQHDRAVQAIRRAHSLDPLSLIISTDVGVILLWAGRFEEAEAELRKVLDLDPRYWNAHLYLALTYEQQGRYEEALAEWRSLGHFVAEVPVLVRLGREEEARAVVAEELERIASDPAYAGNATHLIQAYAALGEREQAFDWMERAFIRRHADLMTLGVDRRFNPLRSDPRYEEMLTRLNLSRYF
jgi:DNA-binding winged helix-turn-helix (wHTH) protein/Tfp pilus assembly protein PilF